MAAVVQGVEAWRLKVSPRSDWIMVEVKDSHGLVGAGEASLHFSQPEVMAEVQRLGEALQGRPPRAALRYLARELPCALPTSSALCALDQALHDLEAQRLGLPIGRLLTTTPASELEVYANINRRTRDRAPAGFAASAREAVAAGFSAIKIAPFDEVTPALDEAAARPLLAAGCARMAAVREALGPDRRLLVDCHWRLRPGWLDLVLAACAELGVFWLETPFPEDDDRLGDIRQARARANAQGLRLAGGELKVGRAAFERLVAAGAYDVLMPDMKYVGGYAEFAAVAEAAGRAGLAISPHSPTGPVCHAHSVQASAACRSFLILEMQFDETAAFAQIVTGELPMPLRGRVRTPRAAGLGIALSRASMAPLETA